VIVQTNHIRRQHSARAVLRQWAPCLAMTLLSLLSYVDRSVLAILSPTILGDLHLTATQYGYAISVFSICYMLANPVWGYWIDRRGLFLMILIAVTFWSLASAGHALIGGVGGLCIARGLLGFGEGATFPAGLNTVALTLPAERRSFGLGLAYSGGSLGAALTPLMITPIGIRYGWRSAFLITGVLGFFWIVLWLVLRAAGLYRPQIPVLGPVAGPRLALRSRWNRNLFAAAAVYGFGAAPLAFGLYAAPLYLSRVLHVGQASLGHLLWIPPAGWEAGYLFWGLIADRRTAGGAKRPLGFFVIFSLAGFLVTLLPAAAAGSHPIALTMLLFFLQMFFAGGFVVLSLADGIAAQPKQNTGFLSGIAVSVWALLTGLLMPMLGHLMDRNFYTATFWLVACLPPLGTILWRVLSGDGRAT
jgi:MFS transporter, ACS family, aldohexuronate transporter